MPRRPRPPQLGAGGAGPALQNHQKTIADFERGATTPRQQTLAQILAALEAQGIELLNGNRPGVRLKAEMAEGDASTSGAVHPNITRAASAEKMYQSRACEPSLMVNSVASLKR